MTGPLVSLITPAYNQGRFLRETIDSVLAQTYQPIEYVVIDDGSVDDTSAVMASYGDRIVAISQPNQGQAATINRGLALARGKYVGYLSSDDILYPEAIARLVERIDQDDQIVCVFPDADLIDLHSRMIKRSVCRPFDLEALVVQQECYIGPGAIFRRSASNLIEGWKKHLKLAPDREYWMRLSRLGRFEFVAMSLAGYRTHPTSISFSETSEAQSLEYINVLDDYFSNDDVDPNIFRFKDKAYGFANFLIARNCIRSGNWHRATYYYRKAIALHSALATPYYWYLMARMALSKPLRMTVSRLTAIFRPRNV